jgi:putative heme degradation protein
VGHTAAPVDQDADLAADLSAQLGELARELVAEQDVRVETSTEQALELLDLVGLQTAGVAVDLDGGLLGTKMGSTR